MVETLSCFKGKRVRKDIRRKNKKKENGGEDKRPSREGGRSALMMGRGGISRHLAAAMILFTYSCCTMDSTLLSVI